MRYPKEPNYPSSAPSYLVWLFHKYLFVFAFARRSQLSRRGKGTDKIILKHIKWWWKKPSSHLSQITWWSLFSNLKKSWMWWNFSNQKHFVFPRACFREFYTVMLCLPGIRQTSSWQVWELLKQGSKTTKTKQRQGLIPHRDRTHLLSSVVSARPLFYYLAWINFAITFGFPYRWETFPLMVDRRASSGAEMESEERSIKFLFLTESPSGPWAFYSYHLWGQQVSQQDIFSREHPYFQHTFLRLALTG